MFYVEHRSKLRPAASQIAIYLPLNYNSGMLVLASSSPRRQELLRNAGIAFTARSADVPEVLRPGEGPLDYAQRLARDKARAVRLQFTQTDLVLGADTIVVVDHHILEKPADAADAARMLRLLSGRTHQVTTGVCLIGEGFEDTRAETTEVTFDRLTEAEIAMYLAHGEPMDKAGAYAIQGIASRWICRLDGCYFNVVGLPVPLVYRMLREHGVSEVSG
jgi:septum formation protein